MSAPPSNAAPFPAWRVPHAAGAEQRASSTERQQEQALEGAVAPLESAAEAAAAAAFPGWHRLSRAPTYGELAARLHAVVAENAALEAAVSEAVDAARAPLLAECRALSARAAAAEAARAAAEALLQAAADAERRGEAARRAARAPLVGSSRSNSNLAGRCVEYEGGEGLQQRWRADGGDGAEEESASLCVQLAASRAALARLRARRGGSGGGGEREEGDAVFPSSLSAGRRASSAAILPTGWVASDVVAARLETLVLRAQAAAVAARAVGPSFWDDADVGRAGEDGASSSDGHDSHGENDGGGGGGGRKNRQNTGLFRGVARLGAFADARNALDAARAEMLAADDATAAAGDGGSGGGAADGLERAMREAAATCLRLVVAASGAAARRRGRRGRRRYEEEEESGGATAAESAAAARVAATARAPASHSPSARRPAARVSASAAAVGGRAGEAARRLRHASVAPAPCRRPPPQQPWRPEAHWMSAAAAAATATEGEAEERAQALADARRRGRARSAGGGARPPHAASAPHWDDGYGRSGIARRHSVLSAGVDGTALSAGAALWPAAASHAPRVRFLSASVPPPPPRAAPPPTRPPAHSLPPAAAASSGGSGSRGGPAPVAVASALAALRTLRARARAAPGRSPYEPSTADHLTRGRRISSTSGAGVVPFLATRSLRHRSQSPADGWDAAMGTALRAV